jgi:hypothetical protein
MPGAGAKGFVIVDYQNGGHRLIVAHAAAFTGTAIHTVEGRFG